MKVLLFDSQSRDVTRLTQVNILFFEILLHYIISLKTCINHLITFASEFSLNFIWAGGIRAFWDQKLYKRN